MGTQQLPAYREHLNYLLVVISAEQGKPLSLPARGRSTVRRIDGGAGIGIARKRMLPCNRADRGCVASMGQDYLTGNGADFAMVFKLENICGTDVAYETYFEKREAGHMQDTFRGTRTLRFLWNEQRGLCPICITKITRNTGWRAHYCVPRVLGGSKGAENRILLHPECHDRVHRQRISVSKPRLLYKGVRRA
jgi:hypothetical protein